MPNLSKTTKDHDVIRSWAEARGATPSHAQRTGSAEDVGVLRLDFPGYTGQGTLETITWEQFFEKFDERNLAFVYEEKTAAGQQSNFNKLISSETAKARPSGSREARKKGAGPSKRRAAKASKTTRVTAGRKGAKKASRPAAKKSGASKAAPRRTASRSSSSRSTPTKALKKAAGKKSRGGRR